MNSFHNTTYQIVWGTKYRRKTMTPENRKRLYGYLYVILKKYNCHVLRINGVSDHLHIITSIPPRITPSKLIQELKQDSSKWLREMGLFSNWGGWQKGYFIATYSYDARFDLIEYVKNQATHHGDKEATETEDYRTELKRLLTEAGILWEEKYLD